MASAGDIPIPIPLIDMQDFPGQFRRLREACEEWGCFRVINHGIPLSLLSEMKSVVGSLLELPQEIKRRNTDVIAGSGYVAPSDINPLYEALGLYDMASHQAVHAFCSQLDASPFQRSSFFLPLPGHVIYFSFFFSCWYLVELEAAPFWFLDFFLILFYNIFDRSLLVKLNCLAHEISLEIKMERLSTKQGQLG